jgi:hypothetical protein
MVEGTAASLVSYDDHVLQLFHIFASIHKS